MASIRKRGNKWQAQVRRIGAPTATRSFHNKADAEAWARKQEVLIERGHLSVVIKPPQDLSLGELLARYEAEVSVCKKGAQSERYRLRALRRMAIASCPLDGLTPEVVAGYRDQRLKQVSGASVRRELTILRHCLEKARNEWAVPLPVNPAAAISKPKDSPARVRRVTADDARSLAEGLRRTRNPMLSNVIHFAIHTGMRRGELLALRWVDINWDALTALLADTKNGHSRTVPLSQAAISAIPSRPPEAKDTDRVFSLSANALRLAWERLKCRANIGDLRFHDLRHEAISRFFEMGLSVPEVSLISGHRDPRMLFRYTHLRATDVAKKLQAITPSERLFD